MKKNITAILINSKDKTITEVPFDGENSTIYRLCGFDIFTCCDIGKRDAIFVDDEGLLKPQENFFRHADYPTPLAGNGMIIGCTPSGNSAAPKTTLAEVKSKVTFMNIAEAHRYAVANNV